MPSAVFPRTLLPQLVTPMSVPTGLVSRGHTGKDQLRSVVAMGREWSETWGPLKTGTLNVETFFAWIEWAYNNSKVFTIKHLTTPGSGLPRNGIGDDPKLVNGAGQVGESINTSGWALNTPDAARAGDVIRIAGVSPLLRITEDNGSDGGGLMTLKINPSIPVGGSPADSATITIVDCTLNAYIAQPPNIPSAGYDQYVTGITLHFREAL